MRSDAVGGNLHKSVISKRDLQLSWIIDTGERLPEKRNRRDELKQEAPEEQDTQDDDDCDDDDLH